MTFSDSMFLFEITVDDIENCVLDCKDLQIKAQFANLFELNLESPKNLALPKKANARSKKNVKVKVRRKAWQKGLSPIKEKLQYRESILLVCNAYLIISNMKKHYLELSLWNKSDQEHKIGYVLIPWSKNFIDYLSNLREKEKAAVIKGIYNIFKEKTLECIAVITLNIKLAAIDEKINYKFKCISGNEHDHFICSLDDSSPVSVSNTVIEPVNQLNSYVHTKKISINNNKPRVKLRKLKNITKNILTERVGITSENLPFADLENYIKYTQSDSVINGNKKISLKKSTSDLKVNLKKTHNIFHYIFGDPNGPKCNKIYCVYYFTVDKDKSGNTSGATSKTSLGHKPSVSSNEQVKRIKIKKCKSECLNKKNSSDSSQLSLDFSQEIASSVSIGKCKDVRCDSKIHRKLPDPPDDVRLLDLIHLKGKCCDEIAGKIEEIVGGVSAKMKIGKDPCFCTCECRFGFTKKTTYCGICGGYEIAGEELARKPAHEIPHPCPIFHKLVDKNKLKTLSTSGSESKKDTKSMKTGSLQKAGASDKRSTDKKSVESDKDQKKSKKKDDRFKFNYGYKGIPPQIGHSRCALPCTGTLGNVPKHMGWLWTAEDIPGMKFRPMWKPGATSKHVVRLLKIARNPEEVISKKRRRDSSKKRPLKRPLLIVHKNNGEFTVTMETMKTYAKQRALNQHPYEDKPVLTYTIGRTEEENRDRRKKKERAQRRLERAQRHFIQDTFKDMCREICLKTYQQALGILPETEDPECRCYPAQSTADKTNMDVSCSCSEDSSSIGSDTDSDEWFVEFTPPNALFDPTYKGKKTFKADNSTQYTYLDYRVKLVDRFGNPVPRFFKGPDGKQQCSDLGGFWSPDHKWLEINVDGFVAPDGRWAPNTFIGPSGEQVDAETGKFQATNGKWLVVGIDGYVDYQGKWRFYPKPRGGAQKKIQGASRKKGGTGDKNDKTAYKSETSWSCLGDASPKQLSKLGIVGHGQDKKLLGSILKNMLARGENVRIPQPSIVFRLAEKSRKNVKTNLAKRSRSYYEERMKCRHRVPSDKGIVAVDSEGNKTYFKLKDFKNKRPRQRIATLAGQGISLSSFHVPCFHSFINSELMKKQQRERLMKLAGTSVATQV